MGKKSRPKQAVTRDRGAHKVPSRVLDNTTAIHKSASKDKRKKKHAAFISRFHALLKKEELAERQNDPRAANEARIEMKDMGGLAAYQAMSRRGERRQAPSNVPKWVKDGLISQGLFQRQDLHHLSSSQIKPIRLLDVGCLKPEYNEPIFKPRYIDIQGSEKGVETCDLLDIKPFHSFDIVVLSLVLNFSGSSEVRGRMLAHAVGLLVKGGYLAIVLPRACVDNSRYFDHGTLHKLMDVLCCEELMHKDSAKLCYSLWRTENPAKSVKVLQQVGSKSSSKTLGVFVGKEKVNDGVNRNNFSITL
eukprot:Clim_evm15s213 gene=Clim_evmTU15s213